MRKLFALLFIIGCALNISAKGEVHLGYCNGVVNKSGSVGATGRNWVDAAISLSGSTLKAYASNDVTSVRVGLAAKINVDTLRVWLRSSLTGDNLAEGEIVKDQIVRGWNEVALSAPYSITGNEEQLFVGYTFKQRGTANAISYTADATQNAFWVKLGADEEWKDLSSQGALSLEAVVTGDNIYTYDIGISNQAARALSNTGETSVSAVLKNFGTATVSSIDLLVDDPATDTSIPVHLDANLPAGMSVDTTFTFNGLSVSATFANAIRMSVSKINGEPDENPSNDNVELPFAHERKVLIEEFTSESCTNCPRLATTVHNVLSSAEYSGRAIAVCHHDGYATDFLSIPADTEYTWFYNKSTTYAPALMIDRYPYFTTSENKPTPVSDVDAEMLTAALDDRLSVTTYTKLNISAEMESADQIRVIVDGFRARPFCDTPARITLYLLEDSITPRNQQGASAGFRHMHVERDINSTWGEVIDWQADGTFTYNYDITLADNWKRENLSLVAFISGYDADDVSNCVIENAEQLDLRELLTSGIATLPADDSTEVSREVYSIAGTRLSGEVQNKGINIIKRHYSDGRTTVTRECIE